MLSKENILLSLSVFVSYLMRGGHGKFRQGWERESWEVCQANCYIKYGIEDETYFSSKYERGFLRVPCQAKPNGNGWWNLHQCKSSKLACNENLRSKMNWYELNLRQWFTMWEKMGYQYGFGDWLLGDMWKSWKEVCLSLISRDRLSCLVSRADACLSSISDNHENFR